jgi:hypothetical protein
LPIASSVTTTSDSLNRLVNHGNGFF